jgi:hypothetical protein
VSVVTDRAEISELSASLMNTARKDWMTLETLDTELPLTLIPPRTEILAH